jgi:hypothetical protein
MRLFLRSRGFRQRKMTTVETLVNSRFGEAKLIHIGKIQTHNKVTNSFKTYDVHSCRLETKVREFQILVALSHNQTSEPVQLKNLKWTSFHFRSFGKLQVLNDLFPDLSWDKLIASEKQVPSSTKLPEGIWIDEISDFTTNRTRSYKQREVVDISFLITVETKEHNVKDGNRLMKEYEFDLLLDYKTNIIVERLK